MKSNNIELLSKTLEDLGVENINEAIDKLDKFMKMVVEWNENVNLTSIVEEDEFIYKHFIDSLLCGNFEKFDKVKSVIDIGTGAGFPGIPLSIVYPDKTFVLLDSLNKRVKFINIAIDELGLKNVKAIHSRAEDIGQDKEYREQFDFCVSRAVARLNILGEYCLPLVKVGGYFAAYKGSLADEEINESKKAIEILGGIVESVDIPMVNESISEHKIVYIKKKKGTAKKYPRQPGTPAKNPL